MKNKELAIRLIEDKQIAWQGEGGLEYELTMTGSTIKFGKQAFPPDITIDFGTQADEVFEKIRQIVLQGKGYDVASIKQLLATIKK